MNRNNIMLYDLFAKMLELPVKTFVEVYVDAQNEITFSQPLTGNTYTNKQFSILCARSWDDFAGVHLRHDKKIEFQNLGDEQGEFYDKVKICTKSEAIRILISMRSIIPDPCIILFDKLKRRNSILAYC